MLNVYILIVGYNSMNFTFNNKIPSLKFMYNAI